MKNRLKRSLYLNYFLFAILFNSLGRVILKVKNSRLEVDTLEFFNYIFIGFVAILASFLHRLGYKKVMLIAIISLGSIRMGVLEAYFWMPTILFAIIGGALLLGIFSLIRSMIAYMPSFVHWVIVSSFPNKIYAHISELIIIGGMMGGGFLLNSIIC